MELDSTTTFLLVNSALLQGLRVSGRNEVSRFGMRFKNLISDPFDSRRQLVADTPQELLLVADSRPLQCSTQCRCIDKSPGASGGRLLCLCMRCPLRPNGL